MARIRSIKPSFFTSETIASIADPWSRLAFIGLWTHADDEGRCIDNPTLIRAALFPLDQHRVPDMDGALTEWAVKGLIVRYQVEDHRYLAVTNWKEHQRINRPTPSKYPSPSCAGAITYNSLKPQRRNKEQGTGNRDKSPLQNSSAKTGALKSIPAVDSVDNQAEPVLSVVVGPVDNRPEEEIKCETAQTPLLTLVENPTSSSSNGKDQPPKDSGSPEKQDDSPNESVPSFAASLGAKYAQMGKPRHEVEEVMHGSPPEDIAEAVAGWAAALPERKRYENIVYQYERTRPEDGQVFTVKVHQNGHVTGLRADFPADVWRDAEVVQA